MSCIPRQSPVPEENPKYLYRYLSLDGPGLFRAERIILHDEIYLTSPARVNDPFDCIVALDFEASDADCYNFLVELSKRKQPHLLEEGHGKWAGDVIRSGRHKEREIQSLILGGLQESVNSVGLLCLTERKDCILMWSHYAASHSGVCLEFANNKSDTLVGQALRVNYPPFYQKAHAIYDNKDKQVDHILLSKARCWAYEAEWRKIEHETGYGLKRFDPRVLTGIILGCKTIEPHRQRILQWVSERELPMSIYQARQSPDGFHIEIEKMAW
jgi:hypothetical protein